MAVTTNNRNLGLDILRALSMFFVICLHILGQGGILDHASADSGKFWFLSYFQILFYCAVDIYGITTGYLMCRKNFRLARVTKIWLTTVFWSVVVSCCFFVVVPETRTLEEMVSMFIPILRGRYWFFTAYFVVMLISPVLNAVIKSLNRQQFHLLFAVLFVVFGVIPICSLGNDVMRVYGGSHFTWMSVLYLVGGYLRVHGKDVPAVRKPSIWILAYFLLAGMHLLYKLSITVIGLPNYGNLMLTNLSPLVLGEAICLFRFFENTCSSIAAESATGKLIRFLSSGVYAVYVIHVHPIIFWNSEIISYFRYWDTWNTMQVFCAMLLTSLVVFVVCILLDALRQQIFCMMKIDKVVEKISDRVENCVRKYIR